MENSNAIHLRSIRKQKDFGDQEGFPFSIPIIKTLDEIEFTTPVTIFVGENGSGKSSLLEAIACAVGTITVGSESVSTDRTLTSIQALARNLKLTWNKRTRKGFFLRAEDFFGYVKNLARMQAEMRDEIRRIDAEYKDRSAYAKELAKMSHRGQLHAIQQRYGAGLDARSHGESFLTLFRSRFVPGGLYLLDEPEAPLSPVSQLGLIGMIREMTAEHAQFIIATHSPILMAFPGAAIMDFDKAPLQTVAYNDLEQVNLLRDFLNNTETFLRHL